MKQLQYNIPTLGAPSFRTTSAFQVCSSLPKAFLHLSVVISSTRVIQPGMLGTGYKSTPEKDTF